jgi:hypothetical protein
MHLRYDIYSACRVLFKFFDLAGAFLESHPNASTSSPFSDFSALCLLKRIESAAVTNACWYGVMDQPEESCHQVAD